VPTQVAVCAALLGHIRVRQARYEDAWALFDQSLNTLQARGCKPGMARALVGLGLCAAHTHTHGEPVGLFQQTLELAVNTASTALVGEILGDVYACLPPIEYIKPEPRLRALKAIQACPQVGWPSRQRGVDRRS